MPARFIDRTDAGRKLARALSDYRGQDAVVYALPRGGVVPAVEVAGDLHFPLDLVVVRKIGYPNNPEYAIGAVTETNESIFNPNEVANTDPAWLKTEIAAQLAEARRRRLLYRPKLKPISAKDKIAIVVDDGIATGLTMRAALRQLRAQHPKELVVAVPLAPHETVAKLRRVADRVVVLADEEQYLGAVGLYYDKFNQLSDEEVVKLLQIKRL